MKIKPSFFDNGGEVDCLARFERNKRLSIRKNRSRAYEVYTREYGTQREEVLEKGSLQDCVDYTNMIAGFDDEVEYD